MTLSKVKEALERIMPLTLPAPGTPITPNIGKDLMEIEQIAGQALAELNTFIEGNGWQEVREGNLPELRDDLVLVQFANESVETVHIQDFFGLITNGIDENGKQLYSKWYIGHDPELIYWQPLPVTKPPILRK